MRVGQTLRKYHSPGPSLSIAGGIAWEAIEIAHTLEYLRHLLHEPELQQLTHLAGHVPPLALVGLGCLWAVVHRRYRAGRETSEAGGQVVQMVVRERTTTTTTTVEREVLYRKES